MKKMDLHEPVFLSRKAGAFVGVAQRTVQSWTEKGLLSAGKETGGTGDRRLYSLLNLIELGIIKSLTNERLPLKKVKGVMSWLRLRKSLDRIINEDHAFLIFHIDVHNPVIAPPQESIFAYSEGEKGEENTIAWQEYTNPENSGKVLILNIGRIIREVLAKAAD